MSPVRAVETWSGPGDTDGVIVPLQPVENAVHPGAHRNYFEHWYFDARLDDGHVVVGFLQASELITRKPGVELHVYKPDGEKLSLVKGYSREDIRASDEQCDVTIGENWCRASFGGAGGLPVHELHLAEGDMAFDLKFSSVVPGWKPGGGKTRYGDKEFFAWVVPAPRAVVEGTVRYGDKRLEARGVGYHDHNWGAGDMKRIIDYWYWGRVYADDLTLLYAYVMTRKHYGRACSKPLMLARGDRVVLSTGEMELETGELVYNEVAHRDYPATLGLEVPGSVALRLEVKGVIDAHDFIEDLPVVSNRFIKPVVNRVIGRPGYFRFNSDFTLAVQHEGETLERSGTTLHEMVALR
jgi:hypothetical protein